MNEEQTGVIQPQSPTESTADNAFFHQARKIEQDMHAIMTQQVKLALIQIVLAILSILAACVLAAFG